jgi:Transposase domain (DUF772)
MRAAGDRRAGSVSVAARSDHRYEPAAGEACADGRLALRGGDLRRGYQDGAGRPPLPTRLMAGLAILKHTYNLSDEAVCERWIENPYYQYALALALQKSAGILVAPYPEPHHTFVRVTLGTEEQMLRLINAIWTQLDHLARTGPPLYSSSLISLPSSCGPSAFVVLHDGRLVHPV